MIFLPDIKSHHLGSFLWAFLVFPNLHHTHLSNFQTIYNQSRTCLIIWTSLTEMVYVTTINNICITTVSMLQTINLKLNTDDTAVKPTKMFLCFFVPPQKNFTAGNYMFKVNNRNNGTKSEICSKLTIKIPEPLLASFWCLFC